MVRAWRDSLLGAKPAAQARTCPPALGPRQALALCWLAEHPGASLRELAAALEVGESSARLWVSALQRKGYATRAGHGHRAITLTVPEVS